VDTSGTPLNGADLVQGTTFTDTGLGNGTTYYYALVAVDSSDNRSAVSGEVNATPAPPPPSAYALSLNGSSQYVTFGAAPSLGASRFTLETWFKRTGAGVGTSTGSGGIASAIPLVTKGRAEADGSNLDMNYFLGIDSASGKLVADFEDMATGGNHPVSGQTVVSQNAWHHAVASYDGAYWRLYLDGVLDAKVAVGAEPRADSIQHAALATAMTSTGVAAGFLQGVIDEARIWNYARSGSQIRAARNSEIASAAGLIGRFGLNEGSGATVTNSAGAANGTAVGSPSWVAGYDFPADATAPVSPAGLAAMPEAGSITLSWTANGEADVAGYDVYRSTSSPVDTSGTPLNGGDLAQGTSYTDSGVALGTTYHYVLVAVDSSDNRSGASDEASATPQPGDPVFVGAGDIASCTSSGDEATANLLDGIQGSVFTIGDNVYQNGLLSEFNSCYDPTWGRQKSRTRPTPGNHDYGNGTNNGGGYFDYYNGTGNFTGPAGDRDKGYYSYDIGDYWHVVVLNTECGIDASCSLASQEQWLRSDLTANASKNVIALWHRPRWSSGPTRPGDSRFQGLWQDLYDHGVELLLVGHDHQYERFAPQNGSGQLDTTHGVREIIVGTGGDDLSGVGAPVANSQVLNNVTWGVLKLTLHRSSFDWRFIPVAGSSFTDSGTDPVHDAPANAPPTATVSLDTSAPQTNDALTATATKSDAEGQPVTLTYVWKVNGVVKRTYTSATALTDSFDLATAGNGDRGDVVSIEVTPNDGIADGTTAAASATVANADPVFGQDLGDRSDLEGTPVSFSAGASDADLEPLVYEATGLPPGITIDASSGAISGTIAADAAGASPYDVAITVRDGAAVDATDTFTWTVTHANRAPLVDSAAIDQAAPRTNDTLTVTVQAHDPDGDPLDYGYQWTKNGTAIVGATSPSLDLSTAGNGDKGDQIAVTVSASDGQTTSTPLTTTPVTVANTPPSATVALDNSSPQTNAVLTATATKSDADGDPVSLTFVWKTDGVVKRTNTSATALTDTFDLSATGNGDPGQTVTVEVTPNDGQAGGAVASDSALVAADTTPPSAPSGLVSSVSSTAVTLDWADNTEADLAGYDVYRSSTSGGPYVKLNSALLTSSTYRDPGAPAAATSYYVVEASDTSGNASQPSAELAVDRGIAFRAAATGLANSAATLTLPRPAGTQNADLLLATIDVLGTAAPSIPAGWTLLRSDSAGSTLDQRIYLHVAGGAEPASYTWTFAGTQNASGVVVAYVGADVTAPVDATSGASSTSAATATAPSLTTTVANALLVGTFGAAASATVAPPAGMLEQAEIVGGGGGKRTVTELADQPAPLVGATGSRSATLSKAAANVGQLVALRPAGSPPPAQTAPGAPQEVTATAGNGTVHVAWTPPTSDGGIPITNYRVYRGTASGAETLLTTVGVVTTWDDTTAANGTTYYYEVAAVNAVGTGPLSSEASATPVAATPGAPASLTAALKGKTISLSWAAPASNGGAAIAGYRIYRGTASGGESLLTTVGNVTTYKDAGVTSGQTYYYYVTAVNSAGEGARSVEASATVR